MSHATIPFVKGHGTGNDFVILSELDGSLDLTPARVRALCDRHGGIGADGILVITRTELHDEVVDQAGEAPYFMDYRNADGSAAQMCGNGARLFAAELLERRLVDVREFQIATRGGVRQVTVDDGGGIHVNMGTPTFLAQDDIRVRTSEDPDSAGTAAIGVLIPNPHAVTWVDDVEQAGALTAPPVVTPATTYPEGVNVKFVRVIGDHHVQMRVFERGVGETLSCGTGACAAAVATAQRDGTGPDGRRMRVDVPGGSVGVTWSADGTVELDGRVEVVARGTIDLSWWESHA